MSERNSCSTSDESSPDWSALREQFPVLARSVYLDTARRAPLGRFVAETMQDFARGWGEQGEAHWFAHEQVEAARADIAALLGAPPATLAFVKNTSEALNLVAQSLSLRPGENVVVSDLEHDNAVCAWRNLEAAGVEIRWAKSSDGRLPTEAFVEAADRRTRAIVASQVVCTTGFRVDLPTLGRWCRERDVRLVVDAIQGAGTIAAPWSGLEADVVMAGAYKGLLGLHGMGFLYVREEILPQLTPPSLSRASLATATSRHGPLRRAEDARRFENGNHNYLGLAASRRAARFLSEVGLDRIEERVRVLSTELMRRLAGRGHIVVTPHPWEERAGVVALRVPDAEKTVAQLSVKGVVASAKESYLRFSVGFYNNEADIETAIAAM